MPDEDLAKQRFMLLQLARLGGLILVGIGVVILSGRLTDFKELGYVLLVLGAAEFFVLPRFLAKGWRTPRQ